MNEENKKFIERFISSLLDYVKPNSILRTGPPASEDSTLMDFPDIFVGSSGKFHDFLHPLPNETFDLILGSIPLGLRYDNQNNYEVKLIHEYSKRLTSTGFGVFLTLPTGLGRLPLYHIVEAMRADGINVIGYIDLPPNILEPATKLRPMLVVTSKIDFPFRLGRYESLNDLDSMVRSFFDQNSIQSSAYDETLESFRGFRNLEAKEDVQKFGSKYKEYRSHKLADVIQSISFRRTEEFEELENSLYLRRARPNNVLSEKLDEVKHIKNGLIQIHFNDQVLSSFFKVFLSTDLGQLILESVTSGSIIPQIERRLFLETLIPVPTIPVQKQIIETNSRLDQLEQQLQEIKSLVSINPQNSSAISKIDSLLRVTNSLTHEQKIKSLILHGESKKLEFKQTFQYCIKKKQKEDYIEISALKTVVGFLNSEGGTLLVGVEDSGLIPGIDDERKKFHKDSNDKFLLHVKDKIKSRLGLSTLKFITMDIFVVDDVSVLQLVCSPSDEEVFLDDKDFYVRTSPSTDKLEGRDLSKYVLNRFSKV